MNKNHKLKCAVTASIAAGMAVVTGVAQTGTVTVCAAESDRELFKDETVYVNADASGKQTQVTVSDWLKNAGSETSVKDKSSLEGIQNVKGEEKFTEDGESLTWETDGKDIYYQGTTDEEVPVSVKLTWYLDGKEIKPEQLSGKSGHLELKIEYINHAEKTVDVDGRSETMYSPFVMATGLVLPEENCSNVMIDNGRVISDGNRNIVVGFAMPGLKESLGITDKEADDSGLVIPETLTVSADVKDFTVPTTFTAAVADLMQDMDLDKITDMDSLQSSLDQLEDAALALVSGSSDLADGADMLSDGVDTYTRGVDQLGGAVCQYMGENGELTGKVTEYVNGVNTVVQGMKDYKEGTDTLADGVSVYIDGEQKLADGAGQLELLSSGLEQVQAAVSQLAKVTDGELENASDTDLKAAAQALADGTEKLEEALDSQKVQKLLEQAGVMVQTGKELIEETKGLESELTEGIVVPVFNISASLQSMSQELQKLAGLQSNLEAACTRINEVIQNDNGKIQQAKQTAAQSAADIQQSIDELTVQKDQIAGTDPAAAEEIGKAIDSLAAAKDSADGLNTLEELDSVEMDFSAVDLDALNKAAGEIQDNMGTFAAAAQNLSAQLPELEKKLDQIQESEENLPQGSLDEISKQIKALNKGMQQLNAAIGGEGGLSDSLGELNGAVGVYFPSAIDGIGELNEGFDMLGSFNDSLLAGAAQLKEAGTQLTAGTDLLTAGTGELASGLGTLGSQMTDGVSLLTGSSQELRNGAAELKDGAHTLASGMKQFDEEGTGKLKRTVEEELGDILDRMEALSSDACGYDTFSGKDAAMDGSVKFVIETEGE